jgi:hypothetical protein
MTSNIRSNVRDMCEPSEINTEYDEKDITEKKEKDKNKKNDLVSDPHQGTNNATLSSGNGNGDRPPPPVLTPWAIESSAKSTTFREISKKNLCMTIILSTMDLRLNQQTEPKVE